jgi:hypothetical protein
MTYRLSSCQRSDFRPNLMQEGGTEICVIYLGPHALGLFFVRCMGVDRCLRWWKLKSSHIFFTIFLHYASSTPKLKEIAGNTGYVRRVMTSTIVEVYGLRRLADATKTWSCHSRPHATPLIGTDARQETFKQRDPTKRATFCSY